MLFPLAFAAPTFLRIGMAPESKIDRLGYVLDNHPGQVFTTYRIQDGKVYLFKPENGVLNLALRNAVSVPVEHAQSLHTKVVTIAIGSRSDPFFRQMAAFLAIVTMAAIVFWGFKVRKIVRCYTQYRLLKNDASWLDFVPILAGRIQRPGRR